MFATKKDFALLAGQISLTSRQATENLVPFLVDVYQVRLWKLIHTPDKADVEVIAQTFHVCFQQKKTFFLFEYSHSVIHKNYFILSLLYTINVYPILAGKFNEYSTKSIYLFIFSLVKRFTIQYVNEKLLQFLLFMVN
jgi:hypothetical protein